MSGDETAGQQQPPERPAAPEMPDDGVESDREQAHDPLAAITTEPGARKASGEKGIERMITEAELVADGHEPDNPAVPASVEAGEKLRERLDEHEDDLVPAWTRPWEGGDE